MLAYLSRYTHRVAISNRRLIAADAQQRHVQGQGLPDRRRRPVQDDDAAPRASSSAASCSTCCRRASTASATTACSPSGVKADNLGRMRELLDVARTAGRAAGGAVSRRGQRRSSSTMPLLRRPHAHHRDASRLAASLVTGRQRHRASSGSTPHERRLALRPQSRPSRSLVLDRRRWHSAIITRRARKSLSARCRCTQSEHANGVLHARAS